MKIKQMTWLLVPLSTVISCLLTQNIFSAQQAITPKEKLSVSAHGVVWGSIEDDSTFVQIESGLNVLVNGEWQSASEEIELADVAGEAGGGAVARKAGHKVIFSPNLNDEQGSVDLLTPDQKRFRSRVMGIAFSDGEKSAFVGETKGSIGELISNKEIIYPDAFDIPADVRYRMGKAFFEQDVIIRKQLPDPTEFGMNPLTTRVQIWTEFFEIGQMTKKTNVVLRPDGSQERDEELNFGQMAIISGKAFPIGEDGSAPSTPVTKQLVELEGSTFLIESAPYSEVQEALKDLPPPEVATVKLYKEKALAFKAIQEHRPTLAAAIPPSLNPKNPKAQNSDHFITKNFQHDHSKEGYVFDYVLVATQSNYTFQSGATYYVSGTVYLSGVTTFEGGTVIKFDNAANSQLNISGQVICNSDIYRPVIFTAKHDNTVGETVASGSPSGYYANPVIAYNGSTYDLNMSNFRISHAKLGFDLTYKQSGHTFRNFQVVFSERAFRLSYGNVNLYNGLLYNVETNFYTPYYTTNVLEHVTSDTANSFQSSPTSSTFSIKNSLFTAVSGMGTYSSTTSVFLSSNSGIFETKGAGAHYLPASSTYRDYTSTSIDSTLASDLKKRTTEAPRELTGSITTDTLLGVFAARDANKLDLGYHYAPIDWVASNISINSATLLLTNGAVVAVYGDTGFKLEPGSKLISEGSPSSLNRLLRYHSVQEMANSSWNTGTGWTLLKENLSSGTQPQVFLRFTEMPLLASGGYHFLNGAYVSSFVLADCQILNGWFSFISTGSASRTVSLTNNLFERAYLSLGNGTDTTLMSNGRNNLFWRSSLSLNPAAGNSWEWKDNVIDNGTVTMGSQNLFSVSNNGYVNTVSRISPTHASDVSVASFTYLTGVFGRYYQSSTSFQNLGSRTVEDAGLAQYTTRTSTTKDTGTVDMGFHYVAQTSNLVNDYDKDGIPDYLEDRNGNLTSESSELDWQNSSTGISGASGLLLFFPKEP